jgi:hypothetical protein
VHKGLNLIGDIKQGDLTLHTIFFDHLKEANPYVKSNAKVAEIIRMQINMLTLYKTSNREFKQSSYLSSTEIDYLYHVFTNLLDQLSQDIEVLTDVLTDGKLEMSDNERIARINIIYDSVTEKYTSLQSFINQVKTLCKRREKELNDLETLKKLYEP